MNTSRIFAVILRHWYNFTHNLDRIVDAFYWPTLDVIMWGLTISALEKQGNVAFSQVMMLVFSVILWNVVWRSQAEITVNLLEELWSENLVNLFASPLKVTEWMVGMGVMSLLKLILTILLTSVTALFMYHANITDLGVGMIPMMLVLLGMGWAFGFFVAGLFLRYGTNVQTLAWAGAFILMPFSAVFYPMVTLPTWVQKVGTLLPSSYVFETMRTFVATGMFDTTAIIKGIGLDMLYLPLAIIFFIYSFTVARKNGLAHLK